MMFVWLALAIFMGMAVLFIAKPFLIEVNAQQSETHQSNTTALRTALDATDRDEAAGLLNPQDANSIRAAIAEDFRASQTVRHGETFTDNRLTPRIAIGAILMMTAMAFASYAATGSPTYRDQPLAWRIVNDPNVAFVHKVEELEQYFIQNPQDGEAWAVIAPIYFESQQWERAANAFMSAVRYGGFSNAKNAELLTLASQSLINSAGGEFTDEAAQVAIAAAKYDTENIKAAFVSALAIERTRSPVDAIGAWSNFVEKFNDDVFSPRATERLAALMSGETMDTDVPSPGPSQEQFAAAADMSEADRNTMIEGMVTGLAMRLEEDPGDIEGWQRLIRSYLMLGKDEDAQQALANARLAFANDETGLAQIEATASELGLTK